MRRFVKRRCRRTAVSCGFLKNKGFTLVEMMVSVLCAAIVMGVVMTWLLVGIRVEFSAADTMERQQKTRVIISLMESMASSGKVAKVQETGAAALSEGEEAAVGAKGTDWALLDDSGKALVRYRAGSGTIVTGSGDVLMDGLDYAGAKFNSAKNMLELSLVAEGQEYSSNIFCRTAVNSLSYGAAELLEIVRQKDQTAANRFAFITLLTSQEGSSGEIIDQTETESSPGLYRYQYFTECYLNNTGGQDHWSPDGNGVGMNWSPKTPWCATYVSWALLHMNHYCYDDDRVTLAYVPLFANVDDGRALFHENYVLGSGFTTGGYNTGVKDQVTGEYGTSSGSPGLGQTVMGKDRPDQKVGKWVSSSAAQSRPEAITPGDLIFFDWGKVGSTSGVVGAGDGSLDHVGVVLYMTEDQIFTIEGNTDGKVAVRNYSMRDPAIVGYGLLDWTVN